MATSIFEQSPPTLIFNSTTIEDQLKCKIDSSVLTHSYTSAIFFADKLLNLVPLNSKKYIENLYILCNALYCDKQYQRSSFLIQKYLNQRNLKHQGEDEALIILKLKYLSAKCKIETNEFDQCLQILDNNHNNTDNNNEDGSIINNTNNNINNSNINDNLDDYDDYDEENYTGKDLLKFYVNMNKSNTDNKNDENINNNNNNSKNNKEILIIKSNIALIKGKCFENMDNLKKAKFWYIKALLLDYNCYEAFESLTKSHLLTFQEEIQLLKKLNFQADDIWLKEIYALSLKKYDNPNFTSHYNYIELYDNSLNNNDNNNNNNNSTNTSTKTNNSNNSLLKINDIRNKLINCNDILTMISEYYFYKQQFQESYSITKKILKEDKYYNNSTCIMVLISSLFELQLTNELYYTCHQLIDSFSQNSSISWYGIACYYQLIQNSDLTQKFFTKATTLNSRIGAFWLGFGHFFATKGEHDQAMAAYRTSSRLLTGCHLPLLCIGMELIRVHNLNLASQYILQAKDICPYDPMTFNELGIIEYKNSQFEEAIKLFEMALEISKIKNNNNNQLNYSFNSNGNINNNNRFKLNNNEKKKSMVMMSYMESWEPTVYNLAHCYRKLRRYDLALHYYNMSLSLIPNNPSTFTALGFCYHLQGSFDEAIDYYHQSLSIRDDTFTNVLLHKALSLSILNYD
ncbi:hypothetical protein DICPUDRAFT_155646 [Dictyostelium purpureum]|uniref:Uncharacterized protein n=1 Tax=Dictyostelium purpureum TaxID=5786 RepID=F0ZUJ6_DICPU|nr:uncharacterized protein DICPUDRAFT_155646 [Dictyostelium purpureum]EGC32404.1 hypothetical protein DICPUDRAFT_155646 [Dictyostelium purpureum]|eukprot:XP_003291090.1 hypothetical protein DICPUDRAFT_155646 [Dictyostelium purpureum]